MTTRQRISISELKVGILVTIALLVLSGVILQQSWGINWFAQTVKAVTYLPDVGGLKAGAPVWLAGIEIGKVTKVSIVPPEVYAGNRPTFRKIEEIRKQIESLNSQDPNSSKIAADLGQRLIDLKAELRFVEIQLQIRGQFINRINRDSEVSIESKGLIGDSFIEISPGTNGIPPPRLADAYVIEGVTTTGFREIMTGANDVIANFGVLSDQFKNIALKINPDKVGSDVSTTLRDMQATMNEAKSTLTHASHLLEDVRAGNGTLGKMVSDPAAYDHLIESLDRFDKIAEQLQNGGGTLGKLMQDPALFDAAHETLQKADTVMARIEKGEGTLGKLSVDSALYERGSQAIERFAAFVDQIDQGEGTLGKLLKDPALYDNLNQSSAEITKFIYDLRQDPKKYLTIRFRLF